MLQGDRTGEEEGKVSVKDGEAKVPQDTMCNDPGLRKFVREASV